MWIVGPDYQGKGPPSPCSLCLPLSSHGAAVSHPVTCRLLEVMLSAARGLPEPGLFPPAPAPAGSVLSPEGPAGSLETQPSFREDDRCVEKTVVAEKTEVPAEFKISCECWAWAPRTPLLPPQGAGARW